MKNNFERDVLTKIFTEKKYIVDIGGGLRIDESRNNRKNQNTWLLPYLKNVEYKVLDKVTDYHPDIVGDVHDLPFEDASLDAVICTSVLEHVEEPLRAMREIYRVLKPGGYLYLYVPFLFYYHAERGYYGDFYRFTSDGVRYLAKDFKEVELCNTRGAIATAMNLLPLFARRSDLFDGLDRLFGKERTEQTSGYHAFCIK